MEDYQISILIAGLLVFTVCADQTFYFINNDGFSCSGSMGVLQVQGKSITSSAKLISHNTSTFPGGTRCGVTWIRKPGTIGTLMSLSFHQTYPQSATCGASVTITYMPQNTRNVFCGKNASNGMASRIVFQGDLAMTFDTQVGRERSDWSFTAILTPFMLAFGGNCSDSGEFLCDGNRCVKKTVLCDGEVNCADESDESDLLCKSSITHQNKDKTSASSIFDSLGFMLLVIVAPLIGFMLIAMIIGIALMVYRRNRLERLYMENGEEEGSNTPGEQEEISPDTIERVEA